jgi:Tfp pilus assembly protein PilO
MAYVGGRREKATLKYEKEVYTPEGAKTLSDHDLRKEYSRLRSIARKRLERFDGTEWTDTQVYQLNKGVYKPLSEIKSNTELRHLFSDVSRYVTASTSSVSGLEKQRRQGVKTLNERGYDFVTKENYRRFADFMEYARVANLNRMYDSKRVADYYAASEKKQLSNDEMRKAFRSWNRKEKKLTKIQNINPRTSSQYRKEIDT